MLKRLLGRARARLRHRDPDHDDLENEEEFTRLCLKTLWEHEQPKYESDGRLPCPLFRVPATPRSFPTTAGKREEFVIFDATSIKHRRKLRQVLEEGRVALGDATAFAEIRGIKSRAMIEEHSKVLSEGAMGSIVGTDSPAILVAYIERSYHQTNILMGFEGGWCEAGIRPQYFYLLSRDHI